jgi:hypothetical protein
MSQDRCQNNERVREMSNRRKHDGKRNDGEWW